MIMNQMTPQQKEIANQFLNNPNRNEALQMLMQKYGVTQQQIEQLKQGINL